MPIRNYECPVCGKAKQSMKGAPLCSHYSGEDEAQYYALGCPDASPMEEVISAPNAKFMEPRDPVAKEMGKSVPKNFNKIVKERARNHARDNELHDLIQTNKDEQSLKNQWVNSKGQKRRKIDDL